MRIARQPIGYLVNFGHEGTLGWKRFILSEFICQGREPTTSGLSHQAWRPSAQISGSFSAMPDPGARPNLTRPAAVVQSSCVAETTCPCIIEPLAFHELLAHSDLAATAWQDNSRPRGVAAACRALTPMVLVGIQSWQPF
jgi:hypothetical protein